MKAPHVLYTPDNFDSRSVNHLTPPSAKDRAEMKKLEEKLDKPEFQEQFEKYYYCRADHEQDDPSVDLDDEQDEESSQPKKQAAAGGRGDPHLVFQVSNDDNDSDDSLGI